MLEFKKNYQIRPVQINLLDTFEYNLPDFITLYNVAGISRESKLLSQSHLKEEDFLFSFNLESRLNCTIMVYKDGELNFKNEMICEAANILLGHLSNRLNENHINSSLSTPNYNYVHTDYHQSFSVKYSIQNSVIRDNIILNFFMNNKDF